MSRWYQLLILRVANLISVAMFVVIAIITLCVAVDWLGHVGWEYPWYVVPFLAVYAFAACVIHRGVSRQIRKL
jgi:hypothetical protein